MPIQYKRIWSLTCEVTTLQVDTVKIYSKDNILQLLQLIVFAIL